jgi:hypothetical protein
VAALPGSVYIRILEWTRPVASIAEYHLPVLLDQLPKYSIMTGLISILLWLFVRRLAPEIRAHFGVKSRLVAWLLQLHLLLFVPTMGYWLYYVYYWATASDEAWAEEAVVVPWHRNLKQVAAEYARQIPEGDSVLLVLEELGTANYAPFINYYLYPRKTYIYPPGSGNGKTTRQNVQLEDLKISGIRWILTYSGPREFDASRLRLERVP